MTRKEKKIRQIRHDKLIRQIEKRKTSGNNKESKNLFDILWEEQNLKSGTSKGMVHSMYEFINMKGN